MSLTSALNNAASGLRATSRAAELVAGNVANVATPGYARRDLVLSNSPFGGVRIEGISRAVDPFILADRRVAQADMANASTLADGLARIEAAIGDPTQVGSLSDRIAQFDSRLTEAASRPDVETRLAGAVGAARDVANALVAISREVQDVRTQADTDIAAMTERVNSALRRVDDLNTEILRVGDRARTASALMEQRQQVIDGIAEILPIREVPRDNGQIALFTTGGASLLEGEPRELGFSSKGFVEPWMTLADGALSGLTLGGVALDTTASRSLLGDGALQAAFDIRDRTGPGAQAALDAVARDLVERFQDPSLDPTLGASDAGLFTDNGVAFSPLNEEGLSQRIEITPAVDPAAGGAAWRLRDGLGATAEGPPGDSTLVTALADRLRDPRATATGPTAGRSLSFASQASALLTTIASERQWREGDVAFEAARLETVRGEEAAGGVDTDDEMQKLLSIEQAYGANARVLQTLDTLMDQILSIT